LGVLSRFKSPTDALDALFSAQEHIRTNRAPLLPENATEEQVAEYRKAIGVPATFGDYKLELTDGLVVGDDDKPMVDKVLEAMHGQNAAPDVVNAAVNTYFELRAEETAAIQTKDMGDSTQTMAELRESWGPDFGANKNAVSAIINLMPEAIREDFMNARMPDGTAMMNSPQLLNFLAETSRQTNPAATLVPDSQDAVADMTSEIETIETLMKNNDDKYWKDDKLQDRYRKLLSARDQMSG